MNLQCIQIPLTLLPYSRSNLPANLAQRVALALELADLRDSLDHTGVIQLANSIREIGDQ
ncbi:hypothetical protein QEH59_17500 [Coraliomargarita sp. SDUM461004]|uniref:Uncharacterized protein n=1 Tax=Thalassobacterium sedimentorum TaxID=3041258 RepID=A0ABU1ANH5_9BACT|nr:hypothetical protein [Coraliomargarita sp. SDUM461004]MDQ8196234.1 hypothetical protein [Coraliomargarita sp. SDUM461004]